MNQQVLNMSNKCPFCDRVVLIIDGNYTCAFCNNLKLSDDKPIHIKPNDAREYNARDYSKFKL